MFLNTAHIFRELGAMTHFKIPFFSKRMRAIDTSLMSDFTYTEHQSKTERMFFFTVIKRRIKCIF